jgi:hypothetical protein
MFEAARKCLLCLAALVVVFTVLGVVGSLPPDTDELTATAPVTVSAVLILDDDISPGDFRLCVTAKIAKGLHIYSVTQQPGGPNPTIIGVVEDEATIVGLSLVVDPMPVIASSDAWPGLSIETHTGTVTWTFYGRFNTTKEKPIIRGLLCASPCSETSCLMPVYLPFVAEVK